MELINIIMCMNECNEYYYVYEVLYSRLESK